jgi:ubiquinone/menaquinone biosynthesis C-methylase UbiE
MTPKDFYRQYQADDNLSLLSIELLKQVYKFDPVHVLDFGCGTGKHMAALQKCNVVTHGIDISRVNVIMGMLKHDLPSISLGDEGYLRHYCNFDVVMTCSVLDHIEDIDGIIAEFKRIANKGVVIAETNDTPNDFYYPHDYEKYGFVKVDNFEWKSAEGDGAVYNVWVYNHVTVSHDELFITN